jgi:taurine dioxygenase
MISLEPSGQILGATVHGIDLAQPLEEADFGAILRSLGQYGVLRFPNQQFEPEALRDFSQRFGSIQGSVTGQFAEPGVPEVESIRQ